MKKEFVPYEQALDLKKLGFNEQCLAMWQKNKKIWFCHKNEWTTNFEINPDKETLEFQIKEYPNNVSLINGEYFLHSCANFTAPLYQQAFRWFRNKGYDTSISHMPPEMIGKGKIKKYSLFIWKEDNNPRGIQEFKDTYEEAELECLKKLIEIVKLDNCIKL